MIKRAAAAGAVAWTAPVILDSLASPAAAATVCLATFTQSTGTYSVSVPANCRITFTLRGGGGGGGDIGGTGGNATTITGELAPQPSPYTLAVVVGGPGIAGGGGGTGGSGHGAGGASGTVSGSNNERGGGGGGSSSLVAAGLFTVVAAGGGGGGGFRREPWPGERWRRRSADAGRERCDRREWNRRDRRRRSIAHRTVEAAGGLTGGC